jgi:hypothetical protein
VSLLTKLYSQNKKPQKKSSIEHPSTPSSLELGVDGCSSSPCLFSNNSIETENEPPEKKLGSYHKKQAQTLRTNVTRLIKIESPSIDHVAFLTLTFQENITDHKEAYERFRSFNSNFLSSHPVYGRWISVKEHQARGAWHFHMIIQLSEDIRTGFDFDQYDAWLKGPRKKGTFPTGNSQLRSLWSELAEVLPGYGFGKIFTLEPIKSNEDAIAFYVGKYVSKQIGQRPETDKGVRLINYSRGWLKNSVNIAWHNGNATLWRKKVAIFARMNGCQELYQLSEKLGSNWAYKYTQEIFDIELVPSKFRDEVYGKENQYKERLNTKLEERLAVRKRTELKYNSLTEEENLEQSEKKKLQYISLLKEQKDRIKKIRKHKNKVRNLLGQKWFTTQENIEEVDKEVQQYLKESPLIEAFTHKQKINLIDQDKQMDGVPF